MITDFATADAWIEACALQLETALSAGLAARGRALFAGAGGSTPSPIYRRLAQAPLDWPRVVATLVDERYVPESSPDSNAALLKQTLLTGPAAVATFVPLYSEAVTIDRAALVANHALLTHGERLDAVLLGMGEDGHIASMFPENPSLKQLLAMNNPPLALAAHKSRSTSAPVQDRISLNLPWLANADTVVLALTGAAKRRVFEEQAAADPSTAPVAALLAARNAAGRPTDVYWTEKA
jgi:6-phosphogluconolactonase